MNFSDSYIKIGKYLLAIEAKAKSPRAETFMGYKLDICKQEICDLLIDPTFQISNRLDEILSCEIKCENFILNYFAGIEEVIALTVSMEKVMPVGELMIFADNTIKDKVKGPNTKICCYHNINIDDYEALCNLVEKQSEDIPQILISWFKVQRTHPNYIIPLANYLIENGYVCNCPSEVVDNFKNAMQCLYKKVFNK